MLAPLSNHPARAGGKNFCRPIGPAEIVGKCPKLAANRTWEYSVGHETPAWKTCRNEVCHLSAD
jgi:hypothetical protein